MSATGSRLRVAEQDGITRIEFVDRNILDEANIQQIGDEISQIIDEQESPRLLISFENVDHLSSAALGTLITINNKIRGKDGGSLNLHKKTRRTENQSAATMSNQYGSSHRPIKPALGSPLEECSNVIRQAGEEQILVLLLDDDLRSDENEQGFFVL